MHINLACLIYSGIANCGINVHSLLHLPHFVRLFGPLWTHSAFSFENQMQNLLQHSHATHSVGKQVCCIYFGDILNVAIIICIIQIAESFVLNQKLHIERRKLLDSSSCSAGMQLLLKTFQG